MSTLKNSAPFAWAGLLFITPNLVGPVIALALLTDYWLNVRRSA